MPWLKQVFNFYLDASIHVAFAVVSFYFISVEMLKVSTNWSLAGFLFFGTIVCYNFIKFGVEAKKYLMVSNPYHKLIQGFSFVCFGLGGYFFFGLSNTLVFAILVLLGVSVFYAIPLLPHAKNLRNLAGLKTYLVALVWTGCTVLLPVLDNDLGFTWPVTIALIQRFILVLVLLLPFEIRDMRLDGPELRTLPQRIGVSKTKKIGYVLLLLFMVLPFFNGEVRFSIIAVQVVVCGILVFILMITSEEQSRYFSSFWVEGLPLLYMLLFFLVQSSL